MEKELSICCDARRLNDNSDICSKCKEHTDFYSQDEVEEYLKEEAIKEITKQNDLLKLKQWKQ